MKTITLTALLLFSFFAQAKSAQYFGSDGVFMDGYDAVSYLKDNKATKGQKAFAVSHDGAQFYFTNQENKNLFVQDPAKYIPAYKGWCAYAMADSGDLVKVDPKSFKIINGKTYFFYNTFWADTLKKWNKLIAGTDKDKKEKDLVDKADGLWLKNHK